jgi:Arc/MetJ family transcription regulator
MPVPGAQAAHAMAHIDAIAAARALHRAMMHRENDAIAAAERHDLGARLHAWALLREQEFAASEIAPRL